MSGLPDDQSARLVRWWVRRYTAGLDQRPAAIRRAEIDSDLAEHDHFRRETGWPTSRIGRERLRRMLAGVPGDIGWRHDRLRVRSQHAVTSMMLPVTTIAQLLLAAYYVAFAVYLLGGSALADKQVWGRSPLQGFEGYADEAGASGVAIIVACLGLSLAIAAIARPVAPVLANAVTLPSAVLAVMFFWLGVWALGLIVLAGAATDLATRAPHQSTNSKSVGGTASY
jgi:hypothetical protein